MWHELICDHPLSRVVFLIHTIFPSFEFSNCGVSIDCMTVTHHRQGETGYIAANRIHDATYVEKCKLVYVHSGAFGFNAHQ